MGSCMVTPSAIPRGMMVTLCSGSALGRLAATRACPASWYAVLRFSASLITMDLRSAPIRILSLASSKSIIMTTLRFWRAAFSADSFTRLARSAPARPGVPRARTLRSTLSPSGIFLVWTRRMASRPTTSGRPTTTRRSKRPGRRKPGSKTPGRVVADGAEQRRIQHVGAVRSRHQDDAFVGFEAVHFHHQLVEGLLALVMSAAEPGAAMAAHRVDFIDENDAGGILLALFEQVAHTAGAHAHEHLDEVRAGDGEERYAGFAGDGAGQQGLAGSRRSYQQNALRNASPELLELLRFPQKLDDLLQLFLGLFPPGNVLESYLFLLRRVQTRAALAETQGLVPAALHLAHHEDPEGEQDDERGGVEQDGDPAARRSVLDSDVNRLVVQQVVEWRIIGWYLGVESQVRILVHSVHVAIRDGDFFHLTSFHLRQELGKADGVFLDPLAGADHCDQQHRHTDQNHPED